MTAPSWEAEFFRRVTEALTPEHYGHGFRAEQIKVDGAEGRSWSAITWEDATMDVSVHGVCPCGRKVDAYAMGPDKVANLLRKITEPPAAGGGC